jgi:opacity protein-like surface antigen
MKRFVIASLLIAGLSPAMGADLPVKAKYQAPYLPVTWQGLYVSGYGLYGANLTNTTISDLTTAADLASAPHGPGLGGSIGYYWQPGSLVFGPRVDLAYANMQGGGNGATPTSAQFNISNATNYLGDVDFIVGLPLGDGKLLGYIGGGFAFGGAKPNLQVQTLQAAANDTSTGWNVLAGLSYQMTPNWQIFIEGDYFQLGDKSLSIMDGTTPIATSTTKYHIFEQKLGLSYKF